MVVRDALRAARQFDVVASGRWSRGTQKLYEVFAFSQHSAASVAVAGKGRLIKTHEFSAEHERKIVAELEIEAAYNIRADIETNRAFITMALRRNPQIIEHQIPQASPDDPAYENIVLGRYIAGLYRCGAVSRDEILQLQASLKSGYSNHLTTELVIEIEHCRS